MTCGHDSYKLKNHGRKSVSSEDRLETEGWADKQTDTTDRITYPAHAVGSGRILTRDAPITQP